ncbi:hypothetical protein DL93DRAFT_2064620 [Clavulina sp. PMI_390]|nr:hypothetical protein DL93DRAFT_2064620 [Clavulina sp. PMI_390]
MATPSSSSSPANNSSNVPLRSSTLSPPPIGNGRARDLLRQHYGLGASVPVPSGKPNDPLDMDSSAFDAANYYNQMLATSSLPTLLKQQNTISEEIRQLDGERQSLVYNHHHELIGASDTIRAMKSRAENLDSDMEKLMAAFSEISRISAKLATEIELETSSGTGTNGGERTLE